MNNITLYAICDACVTQCSNGTEIYSIGKQRSPISIVHRPPVNTTPLSHVCRRHRRLFAYHPWCYGSIVSVQCREHVVWSLLRFIPVRDKALCKSWPFLLIVRNNSEQITFDIWPVAHVQHSSRIARIFDVAVLPLSQNLFNNSLPLCTSVPHTHHSLKLPCAF